MADRSRSCRTICGRRAAAPRLVLTRTQLHVGVRPQQHSVLDDEKRAMSDKNECEFAWSSRQWLELRRSLRRRLGVRALCPASPRSEYPAGQLAFDQPRARSGISTGRLFAKVPEDRRTMARSRALGVDGGRLETASRRGGTSSKTESAPHTIMSAERIDSGGWVWPSATNPLRPHLRPVRAEPLVVCGCTSAAAVARHRHSSLKPSGPARYRPGKTPSRSRGPKVMCHDYLTAFHLPLEPPLSRWTSQGRVLA